MALQHHDAAGYAAITLIHQLIGQLSKSKVLTPDEIRGIYRSAAQAHENMNEGTPTERSREAAAILRAHMQDIEVLLGGGKR